MPCTSTVIQVSNLNNTVIIIAKASHTNPVLDWTGTKHFRAADSISSFDPSTLRASQGNCAPNLLFPTRAPDTAAVLQCHYFCRLRETRYLLYCTSSHIPRETASFLPTYLPTYLTITAQPPYLGLTSAFVSQGASPSRYPSSLLGVLPYPAVSYQALALFCWSLK
jgi:hypothetical protein